MNKTNANYVIFDTDGGSDDIWALLLLLKLTGEAKRESHVELPQLQLLGITICGCGNTDSLNVARNVLRILRLTKQEQIPIFLGAEEPILSIKPRNKCNAAFHGFDGFGDILPQDITDEEIKMKVEPLHAVNAIKQFCEIYKKQVDIIAVGPLTNIGLCYSMYGQSFAENVAHIYIMGGNYQGVGNFTRAAEFNFHQDPEAAHIVLKKSVCAITIVPWEPFLNDRFSVSFDWRINEMGAKAETINSAIALLNKVEQAQWANQPTLDVWNPCDLLASMIYVFGDNCIIKKSSWHAIVDLNGSYTRGQMVLDHLHENTNNVTIIEEFDLEIFKNIVSWIAGIEELKVSFSKNLK